MVRSIFGIDSNEISTFQAMSLLNRIGKGRFKYCDSPTIIARSIVENTGKPEWSLKTLNIQRTGSTYLQ